MNRPAMNAKPRDLGAVVVLLSALLVGGCGDGGVLSESQASGVGDAVEVLASGGRLATPKGITMQPLGKAQGYGLDKESATLLPRDEIAFTDERGMTLYYNSMDAAGESVCYEACAQLWPPALASADAAPVGDWTLIERKDGSRQWAYRDRPLYIYAEDEHIGSVAGNSPMVIARGELVGTRGSMRGPRPEHRPMPEGWSAALVYPYTQERFPVGIAAREVLDALGLVLVSSTGNRTLYAFEGDVNEDRSYCAERPCEWRPLAAPNLASAVGDFDFVYRDDGIKQWTWHGRGLYSYAGDQAGGDAYGTGVSAHWQVATLLDYYMPESVQLVNTPRLGRVLATEGGQTLYRRDGFILKSGSGHSLHRGVPIRPAVGRDIGTEPRCSESMDCAAWQPFLAPADARPSGYWDVYERADGQRQWAYQGYALWTYAGDQVPGDMMANDQFEVVLHDQPTTVLDIGTPYDGATALYWHATVP